jgi:hypothetical protein
MRPELIAALETAIADQETPRIAELLDVFKSEFAETPYELTPGIGLFGSLLTYPDNKVSWLAAYLVRFVASDSAEVVVQYEPIFQDFLFGESVIKADNAAWLLGYLGGQENLGLILQHIATAKPKDAVAHAEFWLTASRDFGIAEIVTAVTMRASEYNEAQGRRVEKMVKRARLL